MKKMLLIKVFFYLPALLFASYVIMIALGCFAGIMNCGHDFYIGPYCLFGKIVLGLAAVIFLFLIFPDIKVLYKSEKNNQPDGT